MSWSSFCQILGVALKAKTGIGSRLTLIVVAAAVRVRAQSKEKSSPFPGDSFSPGNAAMTLNDSVHCAQANAQSTDPSAASQPLEWSKQFHCFCRVESGS